MTRQQKIADNAGAEVSALTRAIKRLDAVLVEPGRWAFQQGKKERLRFYIAHTRAMIAVADSTEYPESVVMPSWWSPKHRYAILSKGHRAAAIADLAVAKRMARDDERVITASIEDGKEYAA